jgi:hypothetical protein
VDWTLFERAIPDKAIAARRSVLSAQWHILRQAGAAPALDLAAYLTITTGAPGLATATAPQLDTLIEDLGRRVRAVAARN